MAKRSTLINIGILVVALAGNGPSAAQSPSSEAMATARELVTTMRSGDQLQIIFPLIMQQLKPGIVQGRPEVERDFDAMLPIMVDILNARRGEFMEAIATVYAGAFSADEMQQATAFYGTPLGQKFLDKMPTIARESRAASIKFGQEIATELQDRMIQELRKRGHDMKTVTEDQKVGTEKVGTEDQKAGTEAPNSKTAQGQERHNKRQERRAERKEPREGRRDQRYERREGRRDERQQRPEDRRATRQSRREDPHDDRHERHEHRHDDRHERHEHRHDDR